ncbi:2OG-Fe dioxygenase family protein [Iodobacter arcticus]|uniref:2OG-Fe dioxygenase family protein n=1 Tax=Iodobacter arcticus TaxID=590593 RepID=A0ABW2QV36_9NEIS
MIQQEKERSTYAFQVQKTPFSFDMEPSLANKGFVLFCADNYESTDIDLYSKEFQDLRESYSRLPIDRFMMDKGNYRQRRFARWKISKENMALECLPKGEFFQSKDVNHLNGGLARSFEPIEEKIANSKLIRGLIRFHYDKLQNDHAECLVYAHQIRIIGNVSLKGNPTPEGIHRDGHAYVAQIMIGRKNVLLAQSHIYDDHQELITSCELKKPLDSILIDDRRLLHSVDPMICEGNGKWATRDMLLLDFNPICSSSFS